MDEILEIVTNKFSELSKSFKNLIDNIKSIKIGRPSRLVVVIIAILIQLFFVFFVLWLIDDRTVFNNDYMGKGYYSEELKWGWVHKGVLITTILSGLVWMFMILGEFSAFKAKDRTFYKLYNKE